MARIWWLGGIAGLVALALLAIFRGDAAASSDDAAACAPAEAFVPAFCLNVPTSGTRRETTIPLVALPAERADVRVETTVPGADAIVLAAQVDESIARVETQFAHAFSQRPRVLVFGNAASFGQAARELFGDSRATADQVSASYGGIFDRPTLTIAVNWSASSRARMGAAIAHELTHLMVRDITGGEEIPTWLDEGIATVIEEDTPGSDIAVADEELSGRSIAAGGAVTLADIDRLRDWHAAYSRFGRPLYGYAANVVRAMRARVGWERVVRVLEDVGRGTRFEVAYLAESRETVAALESRVVSNAGPAIAITTAGRDTVRYTVFAGAANAFVDVSITSPNGYYLRFTVVTDAAGLYRGSFGGSAVAGTYTVNAAGATATFSTTP